ncbi:hypothetical protein GC175_24330 [bacterium]|nr:hypothetical protein [bacterium]
MSDPVHIQLLDSHSAGWHVTIDEIRVALGAPHNPMLLPSHFLKVVLPKLGGYVLRIDVSAQPAAYAFLFPRRFEEDQPIYTLRYCAIKNAPAIEPALLISAITAQTGLRTVFYDPEQVHYYTETHELIGQLDFGHPGPAEVEKVRTLQQRIWNNPPDLLYPADIHSNDFGLLTSLIARADGDPVAFLFGFLKFGGTSLPPSWQGRLNERCRLESQTMGVAPEQRGRRIAYTLKQLQARAALAQGIDIINWTADPLQYPNAALNFSSLRAVAYEFAPNLYDLHNDLNQVSASRFSLTWLVGSERVGKTTDDPMRSGIVRLDAFSEIVRVNVGSQSVDLHVDAPMIAIEIPTNWSQLQVTNLAEAQAWRATTDQIFSRYVGGGPGQYMITAAGVDGERRFLLGEWVDDTLLERIVH